LSPDSKPAPIPDHDSRPFWEACKQHELRVQRCAACGRFRWPPRTFCPGCYSREHEWVRLPGRGAVYSFSIVHHAVSPAFKDETPYVVALVELDGADGQVRLLSNVIDCPVEEVEVGMPVEVVFEDRSPEATVPLFRRVG
jgi:uncharacterized OB-fold protein